MRFNLIPSPHLASLSGHTGLSINGVLPGSFQVGQSFQETHTKQTMWEALVFTPPLCRSEQFLYMSGSFVALWGLESFAMIRSSSARNLPPQVHFVFPSTPSSPEGTTRHSTMDLHSLLEPESFQLHPLL